MRTAVLALALGLFVVTPALANDVDDIWSQTTKELKADAPYLWQITGDHYVGAEASKSIGSEETFRDGYAVVAKYTYTGTWFGNSPWDKAKE